MNPTTTRRISSIGRRGRRRTAVQEWLTWLIGARIGMIESAVSFVFYKVQYRTPVRIASPPLCGCGEVLGGPSF